MCLHGLDKQGVFCENLYVDFILCACFECSVAQYLKPCFHGKALAFSVSISGAFALAVSD